MQRTPQTLKRWRKQGSGPRYSRMQRTPMYSVAALDEWLEANQGQSPEDFESYRPGFR